MYGKAYTVVEWCILKPVMQYSDISEAYSAVQGRIVKSIQCNTVMYSEEPTVQYSDVYWSLQRSTLMYGEAYSAGYHYQQFSVCSPALSPVTEHTWWPLPQSTASQQNNSSGNTVQSSQCSEPSKVILVQWTQYIKYCTLKKSCQKFGRGSLKRSMRKKTN